MRPIPGTFRFGWVVFWDTVLFSLYYTAYRADYDVFEESDETSSQDSTEDNVAFILDLLKLLISGTSLENFLTSKESASRLKQSLRLVTKALDIGDALEEVQNGSADGKSQRSQNRFIHRPHFHRVQKQS
ncbi:unnamed protein product [Rodentolepis nana]|uniref:Uncharacterized protein n=1 Tax=Rodentolepis nana TaxID=102285 RepID=A0A0R3T199_RODNA|nr:unnamed protein product [Rodentolepis nana]